MYIAHALKGRTGQISGFLRYDICPGSTVKLEGTGEQFLGRGDALNFDIFAQVTRVSHVINAEGRQAGTAFQLNYLRTEAENAVDATSIAKHPFFTTPWKGAPIVPKYEFPDIGVVGFSSSAIQFTEPDPVTTGGLV